MTMLTARDTDWISRFPALERLPADIRDRLTARTRVVSLPAGTHVFGPGRQPENMLLMLDGTVRVQQVSENGREIVLYRVTAGESCVLTTACLLAGEEYGAEGIAETPVTAAAIPRALFDALLSESPVFRQFVFNAYSRRITDLFVIIQEIAFARVDIRLAQRLLQLADAEGRVAMTHQQLATELGSAREVISRQLQEFQRRGWLNIGRGTVRLTDREALSDFVNNG